ncbi:MAG: acylneuraminate cytidylyltransferase family protein [Lachnospiraceae bacterium]|nr:acylneuraminate cytidylyltransferase family protein [Lachnospiraceae bacterium]
MNKIAIIPARSGSKGLKNKNIIDLCGKPLMAYSIEAGIQSGIFDRVIVSTDSEEYADIARDYGAEVQMRSGLLSSDDVPTFSVIADAVSRIRNPMDFFVLLQPTSPLRNANHVWEAVHLFESRYLQYDFLVSVRKSECAGVLVRPIDEDGSLKYFDTDFSDYRRQKYEEYRPNGAIFIGKTEQYLAKKHFFGEKSLAYKMDEMDSVDIDTEWDLAIAEVCMQKRMDGYFEKGQDI